MLRLSAILACALGLAPTAFARTWTDDTGTYHIDAELAGIENGRAVLRRPGGAGEVRIPLERLSKADRDFLDRTAAAGPDALDSPLPSGVDANAIQTAEATVKDSIADDLAAAKTTVRRENLINKLLQMAAGNPTDKASRFVLLRKAAVMAAALGERS